MYIYRVNQDSRINLRALRKNKPVPEGWEVLPDHWHSYPALYMVDGEITDHEPPHLKAENENHEKIEKKIREIAISELKKTGDLPPDYEDPQ